MKSSIYNGSAPVMPHAAERPANVRQLSESQFRSLGLREVAYTRPALMEDDEVGCAIYAADGSLLAVVEDLETAWGAIVQNDMIPASLQ
ncbi:MULTISPECIES: hypothetical protein [Acetobacter]|uniref:DUF1150 domain-containing protein n=3 Tax=Acetobacter TaxID=434 RepID=F1YTH6_9PROT|nr:MULTISPECIES: hypothetical protein [Acetobacter]ANA13247.1 hypothetical protein WG31_03890 [Acetobacter oryzifermentans]ASL39649.1 hypothetical protein CBI36_03780 [Acetobacter oryzifermentans]ATI11712.1 hypothetical protein CPF11_04070 [Acetobacter pomorum]AXC25955.1 hypothetical protein DS739_03600 [Acetobacter sp. JWB]AXN00922.1 hypothetical protein CJF59_10430 [Acetobacter pomorum]